MNPYETNNAAASLPPSGQFRHWCLDALLITWASAGLAVAGLLLIGATALAGSPVALLYDGDAYVGVIAAPYVVGFAAFGSLAGSYFRSRPIRFGGCFIPLVTFASALWLSDYFGDLGEGEQIVMFLANGVFIGGLSVLPAFLFADRGWRLSMMTVPHVVSVGLGIYFAYTFGL